MEEQQTSQTGNEENSLLPQLWRWAATRWRMGLDLFVNIILPFLVYSALSGAWGDVDALLVSSVPPLAWSIGEFAVARRIDAMSLLVLGGIVLSLLAFIGGGGALALQLREKLVTLIIGLVFLGSAVVGRPLIWYLARASVARKSKADFDELERHRDNPWMKRFMTRLTLGWGIGLVVEFALGVLLVMTLPIADYLIVAPIVGYGTIGLLSVWTFAESRASRARQAEVAKKEANAKENVSPAA